MGGSRSKQIGFETQASQFREVLADLSGVARKGAFFSFRRFVSSRRVRAHVPSLPNPFLPHPPHLQVVLIQVALSTTETNESQENVSDIVTRINSKFSSLTYQPVVFLHTEPPTFSQYLGLLTAADAFICTSLREGMNLTR